ncbi:MAG: DUF4080 domain-containing protein [Eubacteriales bacterium]
MKKLVLTTLNSQYVHTSLALRTLKENCDVENLEILLREYTINEHLYDILENLYMQHGDFYAFSCYIWNIRQTLEIIHCLKQVCPQCMIILGGPEVSYNPQEYLRESTADIIVMGEGEKTFTEVLQKLINHESLDAVAGITYRKHDQIIQNVPRNTLSQLDEISFPYPIDAFSQMSNQILYYETSRGCPYGCSYCLSSVDNHVRFLSLERVKKELSVFLDNKVQQVKFVDRTFNCDKKRAAEIFAYIIKHNNAFTNFHFEIAADLMDRDIITLLQQAPPGLIQLEIGVQTTHLPTLKAIHRWNAIEKIKKNVALLLEKQNIHLHLDLIAGLPFENLTTFKHSFNEVYLMHPHMLQLGFLKLLKGSPIEQEKACYDYTFSPAPPFEVFSNRFITYDEIIFLKKLAYLVDKYYNTGSYRHTLSYVIQNYYQEPFAFFEDMEEYWRQHSLFNSSYSKNKMYEILYRFLQVFEDNKIGEKLKYDYLMYNKWPVPSFLKPNELSKEETFHLLKDPSFVKKAIPQYEGLSPKAIYKLIHIEVFGNLLIDGDDSHESIILFYKPIGSAINRVKDYVVI